MDCLNLLGTFMNKSVFFNPIESARPELISEEIIQYPDYQPLEIDNIPEELKVKDQFLLYNKQKKPVDKTGGLLKDWPSKGMPFEQVRELLRAELAKPESNRNFHGIGFMPKADGILCVDLDKARDSNGQIKPEIDQLIREIQSCGGWIEKSMLRFWSTRVEHCMKSSIFWGTRKWPPPSAMRTLAPIRFWRLPIQFTKRWATCFCQD